MKQLLYKVWDFERGGWIEDSPDFDSWSMAPEGYIELWHNACQGSDDDYLSGHRIEYIPDRFDILLWTGIKDKNGEDIYDGHIVKLSYGIPPTFDILVIEYADNETIADISVSGWWMRNIRRAGYAASLCKTYENDLEIIGHKYTHSHLLKEIKGK